MSQKKEIKSILDKALQSSCFQEIRSLIKATNENEVQTIKNRRKILAQIHIHCHEIFKEDILEKGRKAYLLNIFPQMNDSEQNLTNQNYRNKYRRAMRLLDEQKAPLKLNPLIKRIEKIGFQSLFNGKITDKTKKQSKFDLNMSIQKLLKKKTSYQIICSVLKNIRAKNTEGDFIVYCSDKQIFYTSQKKLIKELKKADSFEALKNKNPQK